MGLFMFALMAARRNRATRARCGHVERCGKRKFCTRIGGSFVFHEGYSIPWPDKHRFPMWKYQDLADQLVREERAVTSLSDFARPSGEISHDNVLLCHGPEYYW